VSGSIETPTVPAFRVTGAGGGKTATTVLSGSYTVVDYNQGNHWNNSTGTFTAPITGLYQVNLIVRTNSNSLGTISQIIVYKNNTTLSPSPDGSVQIMVEFHSNTTMNHAGGSTISKLKNLSEDSKRKVLRYTLYSLLAFNTVVNVSQIINSSSADPETKEIAKEILQEEKYKKGYEWKLSNSGWNHIKEEEGLKLKACALYPASLHI
jgi:hypothetical protein